MFTSWLLTCALNIRAMYFPINVHFTPELRPGFPLKISVLRIYFFRGIFLFFHSTLCPSGLRRKHECCSVHCVPVKSKFSYFLVSLRFCSLTWTITFQWQLFSDIFQTSIFSFH
jgi:hypothetical protein